MEKKALTEKESCLSLLLCILGVVSALYSGICHYMGWIGKMEYFQYQLCAQLRVCNQVGGNPIYPRSSQPDNSESWDVVGNSN